MVKPVYEEELEEADVLNDLGTDVLVEFAGKGTVFHEEVLLDGGGSDLDVEGLVLDEDVGGMALDEGTHDDGPRLDETVLIVGGLNTVDTHELLNGCVYSFGVTFAHDFMSPPWTWKIL